MIEETQNKINLKIRTLNEESSKRTEEIKILGRQSNSLLTEDDETEGENRDKKNSQDREGIAERKRDPLNRVSMDRRLP